ncbi:hypothetical protein E2C01_080887 [Portunus trituberculatus]|uniref:Uncharacterized protein n=1 Tax=Portunus trituberculatus TaxID=210409 RepID=A0A5B7IUD1_PORTR|nr:hypothetical protein [Portunus trituberculatus]
MWLIAVRAAGPAPKIQRCSWSKEGRDGLRNDGRLLSLVHQPLLSCTCVLPGDGLRRARQVYFSVLYERAFLQLGVDAGAGITV